MKIQRLIAAAVISLAGPWVVRAGEAVPPPAPAASDAAKPQTACPVMGGAVKKDLFVDYAGKRIYVCCTGCIATVRQDPAKYVKQLEAQGVVLDKTPPPAPEKK